MARGDLARVDGVHGEGQGHRFAHADDLDGAEITGRLLCEDRNGNRRRAGGADQRAAPLRNGGGDETGHGDDSSSAGVSPKYTST